MKYEAENLKGYLEDKGFPDFLIQKTLENGGKEKDMKISCQVDTNIQVKTDGSRVLVMTRRIGGMSTIMSIELSKPTKLPNDTAVWMKHKVNGWKEEEDVIQEKLENGMK